MSEKKKPNRSLRLVGIAAQMGVTIFLGAWCGRELDERYPMEKKWWTIGLTILAVAISLYSVAKQLNKINELEEQDKKQENE